MPDDISSFLGVSPTAPALAPRPANEPVSSDLSSKLVRRYSDAFTEAHAVISIGKIVKGLGVFLFIATLLGGFAMASNGDARFRQSDVNGTVAAIGFAIACLIGIPTYILGILVAAQGQTQLATLDTAVNSSRHLNNDEVARVLSKRFSL